jgi:hypothetical protein
MIAVNDSRKKRINRGSRECMSYECPEGYSKGAVKR